MNCFICHGATPSDLGFSNGYFAPGTYGPYKTLAYYATSPANITTSVDAAAVTFAATPTGAAGLMVPSAAGSKTNQNDLSAYFASLMTPVLTNPGNMTWSSGATFSYQIGSPAATDYLVSTTTYSVSATGGLSSLSVSSTGLVTGTLPTVTKATNYTVTLTASNAAATTGTGTGSVSFTLTVQ
jgi:hypothetical protein